MFNCQINKQSYSIYILIIFPLEKVHEYMVKSHPNGFLAVKLEDCFEHYQVNEILSGSNQIYCNNIKYIAIIAIKWEMLQMVINYPQYQK